MELRLEVFSAEFAGLAWGFQVNPVSCGNNGHYEEYIRLVAASDRLHGYGTTHAIIGNENGADILLGFITLRASSYIILQEGIARGNAALEIVELAIDRRYERIGIGSKLVDFAVAMADSLNEHFMGVKYIVLCADELAVPFYESYGFSKVSDYGDIPRNGANDGCVPMVLRIKD
jgi:ribosomal protein S18 acetylase RimI-like enzyme